jgi:hypothetical protein
LGAFFASHAWRTARRETEHLHQKETLKNVTCTHDENFLFDDDDMMGNAHYWFNQLIVYPSIYDRAPPDQI